MAEIKKVSEYKQVIEPTGGQKVPVVFHVSEDLLPNNFTTQQLVDVASNPHVFHHVSAMADVHQKPGRKNPSGSVVATKGVFMPQLNDTAPNCGMRLLSTPFSADGLSEDQIDDLFNDLVKTIPTKTYVGTPVSYRTSLEIAKRGSAALLEKLGKNVEQIKHTSFDGNMFEDEKVENKDLFEALPRLFFRIAQLRLGVLGAAGNHFVDLMKVTDILEEETAKKFGLKKDQYLFMIHTGSGLFGQYASYFYTPKIKEHKSQKRVLNFSQKFFFKKNIEWHQQLKRDLPKYKTKKEFFAIDENSDLGRNFYVAHRAAGNFGFANRVMIEDNLNKSIEKTLGKKDSTDLIYDMTHVCARKEKHFGEDVIVHRSNTTRALGPNGMKGTVFEGIGEPVFLPSSMSTAAYFGVGTDENQDTFFSAAHGTGKTKDKKDDAPKNKAELFEKMKKRDVKLYNAKSKEVIEQDASNYKNVEVAIEGMKQNNVMKPVVKMMPVAVLMY